MTVKAQIRTYGDPVLRQKAVPVREVDRDIRRLVDDLLETMYAHQGLGLAAEQIGRTEAVCVVDVPPSADTDSNGQRENPHVPMPLVLINPEILETAPEKVATEEGCLSFPGIYVPIERPAWVRLRALDRQGASRELTLRGLAARAALHEIDHLGGVLIVDRVSPLKRIALTGRLMRMKREARAAR